MKRHVIFFAIIVLIVELLCSGQTQGQSPDRFSYQAILRNSNNELIKNQQVGMRISILQGSPDGTEIYIETQTPTTNNNGLITLQIGGGDVISGNFSEIDWSAGPYFLKVETDPEGGTDYTLIGTSQLLSVPYAFYAKKAGNTFSGDYNDLINSPDLSGFLTSESDPVFSTSIAAGIMQSDTAAWNNKLDSYTETDPIFSSSLAHGITQQDTAAWNSKLDDYTETDPVFLSSLAHGITQEDTAAWNNKLDSYTETDPVFSTSLAHGITQQDTAAWNSKLDDYTETDPVFSSSLAHGITQEDTAAWNNKLDSYTETDPLFNSSVAKNISSTDTTNWNTAYQWGNHALAGYDTHPDSWTGDTATYTLGNIGIKTPPTMVNLQIGKQYTNFFLHSFQDIDTTKDRTLLIAGSWEAGSHTKSALYLGGNHVAPDQVTGSLTFVSGAWENAAIQGREGNNTDWSGELVFLTRQDENPMTEKMRITETGNVGIGTPTPTSKLTVNGTIETTTGGIRFPDGTTQTTAAPQHYVGELYGGGIIFYVYDNGRHGLIASLDDIDDGNGAEWGLLGTDVPDCESAWDGASNTAAIIAAGGAATEAAGLCDYYSGGGYSDWYLPAIWELSALYLNAYVISRVLETDGDPATHGLTAEQKYWSSTEVDADNAVPAFGYDNTENYVKDNTFRVRAVRSF